MQELLSLVYKLDRSGLFEFCKHAPPKIAANQEAAIAACIVGELISHISDPNTVVTELVSVPIMMWLQESLKRVHPQNDQNVNDTYRGVLVKAGEYVPEASCLCSVLT